MLRLQDYSDYLEVEEKWHSVDIYIGNEKVNISKGKKLQELIDYLQKCNK